MYTDRTYPALENFTLTINLLLCHLASRAMGKSQGEAIGSLAMKTCKKCKRPKPIQDFYIHSRMKDGHLNFCKTCVKKRVQDRYEKEFEKIREYEKKRFQLPERKVMLTQYQTTRRRKYPGKEKSRQKLNNAVRDGRIVRQPCEVCGTTEKVQAHHTDYRKWNDVKWYCFKHHREVGHGQLKHTA